MNRLITLIFALTIVVGVSAQKFEGFFKPVTAEVVAIKSKALFDDVTWLFRPNVAMTALAIDLKEKTNMSLQSAGVGISLSKFTIINDAPYCNFSVNASLLTSINLNGEASTKIGGSLTVDVFNKIIGAGIGYIDKKVLLLTTLSYSF